MDNRAIIVALDFPDAKSALDCAARLDPGQCRVKVGKELFVAAGPALVASLRDRGHEVFLDLKFHDIPNTVGAACRAAANLGVWMTTVHASGGEAMMRSAREAVAGFADPPLVVAVTILTSLDDRQLARIGFSGSVRERVDSLARLAAECGLAGVVCSAREASAVRAACGGRFAIVTPGIRLPGEASDDQSRVVTPAEALRHGADYLVIGRPVTRSADPQAALAAIRGSLREGQEANP